VPLLAGLALLAVLLPLLTNRAFYCQYICPYGALQELAGQIPAPKLRIKPKLLNILKELPGLLLLALAALVFSGLELDLNLTEPFSAFLLEAAPIVVIVLAVVFVALSIFTPKPWCNYFCPTGRLLKLFRTKQNDENKN
jgi:polyferredoxin